MIKLIVTDVDGTLLDNNSILTGLNKRAILECCKKGIGIILATGKSIDSILSLVKLFSLKLPQITLNGSVTVNKDLGIIDAIKIEPSYYFEVIRTIKGKGYSPLVALVDGRIFYENYHTNMEYLKKVGEKLVKTKNIETGYFAKNAVSINIPIEETDPLDGHLRNKFSKRLQLVRSGRFFFDMLSQDATKGNALANILSLLNVKKDEVVVFGDSYNDLSMFKQSGLNIAVKNSYPDVLRQADIITDENYNSGLGKAIYKYVIK